MRRRGKGEVKEWIKQEQSKHPLCKCGCGQEILIQRCHLYAGIPKYIRGHAWKNKKHSEKTKDLISLSHIGIRCPEEAKEKIRESRKKYTGENHPSWVPKIIIHCNWCGSPLERTEHQISLSEYHFCNMECYGAWKSKNIRGEKCASWKGGISPLRDKLKQTEEYKSWRTSVYKKDNYICQDCFERSGDLNAHHKKFLSELTDEAIKQFPKLDSFDACLLYDPMWDTDNGITLCKKCHKKEHWRIEKEKESNCKETLEA